MFVVMMIVNVCGDDDDLLFAFFFGEIKNTLYVISNN